MAVAVNRPMHVQELSTVVAADMRKVRNNLALLERQGVLVRARTTDGVGRFAAIRRDNLYRPLRAPRAHGSGEPAASRFHEAASTAERLRLGLFENHAPRHDAHRRPRPFQTRIRTRVLLAIAACGETDAVDLAGLLIEDERSVWNVVNHWERRTSSEASREAGGASCS
jgi:hypothetical protein